MRKSPMWLFLALAACGGGGGSSQPDADPFQPDADPFAPDADPSQPDAMDDPPTVVYVHTASELYVFDATSHEVTLVGPFELLKGFEMTDIAIDSSGQMWGTDGTDLYTIDSTSGLATLVRDLEDPAPDPLLFFNGMGVANGKLMVGTGNDPGTLYQYDTTTGLVTSVGEFGGGLIMAGDIAQSTNEGVFVALQNDSAEVFLASLDPSDGSASVIGNATGLTDVFGLAFSGTTLYAFMGDGSVATLDTSTGVATPVSAAGGHNWYGAASK